MGTPVTTQRQRALFAVLLGVLATLQAGCTDDTPAAPPEAPKAAVMHPEQRPITNDLEFNGWMQPDKVQEIRARVRGHIMKVDFTDGQIVKKGDLLFEIDPRPFQNALNAANAKVSRAEADLELAKKEYVRSTTLQRDRAASREEVDVNKAKQGVAEAERLVALKAVDQSKLDLEYCRITADITGRISKAELTEGNLVNAGGSDPLLTTIVSTDPIRVYFNIDERSLQRYAQSVKATGKNVTELMAALRNAKTEFTFALEGDTEYKHKGVLAFSDNKIDPGTGTIQLYGTVPNKDGFYVPGARVHVRIATGKPAPSLLVPETAVLSDQDKRYVLIADEKNVVRRRNVTLGVLTDDGLRAFTPEDRLPEGEKPQDWWVIVDNLQRCRPNYPVDPQKPAQAEPGINHRPPG
jgi:RND family efflux transporter MFP subunit